jgi:hypothetical protein
VVQHCTAGPLSWQDIKGVTPLMLAAMLINCADYANCTALPCTTVLYRHVGHRTAGSVELAGHQGCDSPDAGG